jgi:hypothetical protein
MQIPITAASERVPWQAAHRMTSATVKLTTRTHTLAARVCTLVCFVTMSTHTYALTNTCDY